MLRSGRYRFVGWKIVDTFTCILLIPFQHALALTISSFIFTCFDRQQLIHKIVRYILICPFMICVCLILLPFGIMGYVLWMLLNAIADVQPFAYGHPVEGVMPRTEKFSSKLTICSANVCIGPENTVRFNNQRSVYRRIPEIGQRLLIQDVSLNKANLTPPVSRENIVVAELPDVDVFMLQEVFNRCFGYWLYGYLKHKYPYCLYDVGQHTFLGNHGGLGSGLFVASRYPIIDAAFHPFTVYSGYGHFVNMGVLIAKLDLGKKMKEGRELRAVSYMATLHAQAYQGPDKIIAKQLEEAEEFLEDFIKATKDEDDVIICRALGGDFNCDNMSPGDSTTQNLSIWSRFQDPCRECAGQDKSWAVGTEHRQTKMNNPLVQDRHELRKILIDDVVRRHFIIDADVMEQTMELMTCDPKPDENGRVEATKWGGRRRIDYLLYHKNNLVTAAGFWFSTVLAGLTDHIPVVLMLESSKDHSD